MSKRNEHGVFVPLAAAVLAGVLTLLFAAGVDALLLRLTRSALQQTTNSICSSLAYDAIAPDISAPAFRLGVESLQRDLHYGSLTDATLVMSLPREDQLPDISPQVLCSAQDQLSLSGVDGLAASPAGGDRPYGSFSEFNLTPCAIGAAGDKDCTLWAYPNVELPPGFPAGFVESLLPGRGIGCRLTASVKRYSFGSPIEVSALSLYATLSKTESGTGISAGPRGLRIGISTQLTTPPLELVTSPTKNLSNSPLTWNAAKTEYALAGNPADNLNPFMVAFDPFCSPPSTPAGPWCQDYLSHSLLGKLLPIDHLRAFSAARPISPAYPPPTNQKDGPFVRGGPESTKDQRVEQIIDCLNPPVLIRNIVSQTLVSMAARDPALRQRTEISHVNPRNWSYAIDGATYPGHPLNYPTIMVPAGTDITARDFEIPFVTYRHDPWFVGNTLKVEGLGTVNTVSGESRSSIYPFKDPNDELDDGAEIYHAELATQLRKCLHLYSGTPDGALVQAAYRGLEPFRNPRLADSATRLLSSNADGAFSVLDFLYRGTGSDIPTFGRYKGYPDLDGSGNPIGNRVTYLTDPDITVSSGASSAQPQEQEYPFVTKPQFDLMGSTLNSERLSAVELASVLGSSQRCPYSDITTPGRTFCPSRNPTSTEPNKDRLYFEPKGLFEGYPSQPDSVPEIGGDLMPDITAFMYPLVKDNVGSLFSLSDVRLYTNKLGWKPPATSGVQLAGGNLGDVPCEDAGLVLITHNFSAYGEPTTAITPGNRLRDWAKLFQAFRKSRDAGSSELKTPMIVIVIPTLQSVRASISDLRDLLEKPDADDVGPGGLEFLKHDPGFAALMLAPEVCIKQQWDLCTDKAIHAYWAELLDPASPNYLVPFIRRFFFERLYRVKRVL